MSNPIPEPSNIDYDGDLAHQRAELARKSLTANEVLDEMLGILGDMTANETHPLWPVCAEYLARGTIVEASQINDVLDMAIDALVERRLADTGAWEIE